MHAQTAMIENGFVHMPKDAGWLPEYLHELTVFPKGKHDDQADSTAQMLDWFKQAGGSPAPMPGSGICIKSSPSRRARRRRGPRHYRRCCPFSSAGDKMGNARTLPDVEIV
jgi:hypothetical protein